MKSKLKFRLDFWRKSFYQEPHLLGRASKGALTGLADALLPSKLRKMISVVADIADDGKLNRSAQPGDPVYEGTKTIFSIVAFVVAALLLVNGIINFDQFMKLVEQIIIPMQNMIGLLLFSLGGVVLHGQLYRVKYPFVHPDTVVHGQGSPNPFYQFIAESAEGRQEVRDHFGDVLQASKHVPYPHGADAGKRNIKYIEENLERFELISPEEDEHAGDEDQEETEQ